MGGARASGVADERDWIGLGDTSAVWELMGRLGGVKAAGEEAGGGEVPSVRFRGRVWGEATLDEG